MFVPGFKIGHTTNEALHTGCTVILSSKGAVGSVDIRGPGPGTRETALLSPARPVHKVNAVVLTGGSAFGLASADGVMRYLAERGLGHETPVRPIPIVTAAVIYDLFLNGGKALPNAEMGYTACLDATEGNHRQGNVGAGAGATVGKWAGPGYIMKGGFGLATFMVEELVVGAATVVNSRGDVVAADGTVLAGARAENGDWLFKQNPFRYTPDAPPPPIGMNTTLIVVATNAKLSKVDTNRLAQRAHDGLAIAVRPAHMTHEGDTAFALASGDVDAPFDLVANLAVELVSEAIRNAVRNAISIDSIAGLYDGG